MFAENDQYAGLSLCVHAQLHIGLDAAYCPKCKKSFNANTKEYKQANDCEVTRNIALVQHADVHLYQLGEPGTVEEQLLCNSDSPEHLYQPDEPGTVGEQLLCNSDADVQLSCPAWLYQVGDRVSLLDEPVDSVYEIVKISGGHATCRCLTFSPGPGRSGNNRRVPLWKVRPSCAIARTVDPQLLASAPTSVSGATPGESAPDTSAPTSVSGATPGESAPDTSAPTSVSGATPGESAPDTSAPTSVSGATPGESAPDTKHWVEVYSPGKRDKSYFRYVWMRGRKLNHVHIPGGQVRSLTAANRMTSVEEAIDAGRFPQEIEQLIKSWRK